MTFVNYYITNKFYPILWPKTVEKVGQKMWVIYNNCRTICVLKIQKLVSQNKLWNNNIFNTFYSRFLNSIIHTIKFIFKELNTFFTQFPQDLLLLLLLNKKEKD